MATTYDVIATNKRRSIILIAVFAVFVILLGWVLGQLFATGSSGVVFALVIAVVMTLMSYSSGDRIALWTAGAQAVTKEQAPEAYRIVENLAITAGLPSPKLYIMLDPSINAFATGRDPKHASIAVTTGALEKLENEELEGVLAHELSHIKNYDVRLMMLVVVLVGSVTILANMFFRARWLGGRSGRRDNQAGSLLMIIGLVLLILSPIFARLIQFAVSRRREFLADASGALLTRYPEGLARALEKISAEKLPLRQANEATAPLYISNPFGQGKSFRNLFSTHPQLDERIKALRAMGG